MSYKNDHIKVLKTLGTDLPKRPSMKTSDIASKGFKGQEDADRRVRNAYRMLRKYNHIEIAERGDYRITQAGASLYDKLEKNGWKMPESEKPKRAAPVKKAAKSPAKAKKVAKKSAKKVAKKVAKKAKPVSKAKAKPASKAKAKGKMPSTGKKESKPAAKPVKAKAEPVKAEAKSNGTPPAKSETKASSSQLAF